MSRRGRVAERAGVSADCGRDTLREWDHNAISGPATRERPGPGRSALICHPKGRKRWNGGGKHALWTVPIVLDRSGKTPRLHTTQKPEPLMAALVDQFTDPGETILDAFAGSGTTLLVAAQAGRKAIGIERSEAYCEVIGTRLQNADVSLFGEVS